MILHSLKLIEIFVKADDFLKIFDTTASWRSASWFIIIFRYLYCYKKKRKIDLLQIEKKP